MLSVVPFDDRVQKHPSDSNLPQWLPKHEFLMLIIAPAGSGKTTLILNILLRVYQRYWNRMYIFSPTIHNDAKWKHLKECKTLLSPMQHSYKTEVHPQNSSDKENEIPCEKEETESDSDWECSPHIKELEQLKDNIIIDPLGCKNKTSRDKQKRLALSKEWYLRSIDKTGDSMLRTKNRHKQSTGTSIFTSQSKGKDELLHQYSKIDRLSAIMYKPPLPEKIKRQTSIYDNILKTPIYTSDDDTVKIKQTKRPAPSSKNKTQNTTITSTMITEDQMFDDYNESTLSKLMDDIDHEVKACSDEDLTSCIPRTLWVFDDMVGSGLFSNKRNYAFKRLTVRRRHFYSSLIGVTQAYKEIPKTTRTNANCIIFFRIDSDEELIAIYREFPMGHKFNDWLKIVKYCTEEPYSFIMFNLQTSDLNQRIIKNFDQPLSLADQNAIINLQ